MSGFTYNFLNMTEILLGLGHSQYHSHTLGIARKLSQGRSTFGYQNCLQKGNSGLLMKILMLDWIKQVEWLLSRNTLK